MLIPASLLLAGAAMPLPLAAQAMVQPLPGTTDADKLADLVRQIGRNPRDVRALVDAGDLSAKLGDTTAAASLYKRASQVDPNNARVQAGIARILVNGEHPGEALRYFNQAERAGLSPATFAGDRGLAFDLIGEQERAQRDYRVALARPGEDDEDEVRRRYALSLGISGRKDEALQQIDALLRKSDRGAWRARAFILAMNGDASGATSIATTMMPAGMGAGLAAFFTRLPTLSPADRAFAVHFGEVTPTPERIADARLVPPLPALAPDPYARPAGVQVAAQTAATPAPVVRNNRRGRESRERYRTASRSGSTAAGQVAAAAAVPAQTLPQATTPPASSPTQVAQALVPARPSYTTQPAVSQPTPAATQVLAATATGPAAPVTQTSLTARPTGTLQPAAPAATLAAAAETRTIVPTPATTLASAAAQANNAIGSQSAALPRATGALSPVPTANAAAQTPVALAASNPAAPSATPPANEPAPAQPTQLAAAASSAPVFTPPPRDTAAQRVDNGDTILARIVANISIPASELGVAPMPGAAPQPGSPTSIDEAALTAERNAAAIERRREREATAAAESRTRAAAPTKAATAQTDTAAGPKDRSDDAASSKSRRTSTRKEQLAQAAAEDTPATKRRGARATDKKTEADEPKLTPRQAAAKAKADAKALADAKAAAADKKAAAAEKKAARTEPERYWVQVAGGATQNDLAKAWKNVRAKSSLLANRAGYTTPLRATNRVVTGPFKTQDEAQAMVNKLSKDGVSAFSFTSEAGQKMTKLGGK